MRSPSFLVANARWLGAGAFLSFLSSFGQTFFIGLFGAELRAELGLSQALWGGLYTLATLASAMTLAVAGALADRLPARLLAAGTLGLCALACLGMASVAGPFALAAALYGLRFCGQGMLSHVAITATGRWFRRRRGRALAIASLGFSGGEALLPAVVVALTPLLGWRGVWLAAAAFLLVAIPLALAMLARDRTPEGAAHAAAAEGIGGRSWTRGEALRHWAFRALTPGLIAPPLIATALFFHQRTLAEAKGWALADMAAAFPVYALTTVATSFLAAAAVDRVSARALLPVYQAPMACGALLLAAAGDGAAIWPVFALFGLTQGGAVALLGALWPEIYGVAHVGAIRAVAVASMVVGTALGPGLTGVLLDLGVSLDAQFAAMGAASLGFSVLFGAIVARLGLTALRPERR